MVEAQARPGSQRAFRSRRMSCDGASAIELALGIAGGALLFAVFVLVLIGWGGGPRWPE